MTKYGIKTVHDSEVYEPKRDLKIINGAYIPTLDGVVSARTALREVRNGNRERSYRKMFNQRVVDACNQGEPFLVRIYCSEIDNSPSLNFIRHAGYCVNRNDIFHCWDITIPDATIPVGELL